jgi:hypothetical protein
VFENVLISPEHFIVEDISILFYWHLRLAMNKLFFMFPESLLLVLALQVVTCAVSSHCHTISTKHEV